MRVAAHIVRDVVHGYITLDEIDRQLLDEPIIQRLRYVRQNDVAYLVYPSLNTTRFEHSLGVFHLAGLLAESALNSCAPEAKNQYLQKLSAHLPGGGKGPRQMQEAFCRAARWYGLLHDVGHLPFSHLTEYCLERKHELLYADSPFEKLHESAGRYLASRKDDSLSKVFDKDPAAAWIVRNLLTNKLLLADEALRVLQPLKDIVDSDVDADRIDSTARDGLLSGGDYGHYDISRLSHHATLFEHDACWRVFFTTRAVSAVESLLVERCNTYRWIHYKPKVIAFKNAFRHCFMHLKVRPTRWHAEQYVNDVGYLDDAQVLSLIGSLKDDQPRHVQCARLAILRRAKTAIPLWKRRDEFVQLSRKVAEANSELTQADAKFPVLNQLADVVGDLEKGLNQGLKVDDSIQYLVCKTVLHPFEPSVFDETISHYGIISHKDRRHMLLTSESRMVQTLRDVVNAEPAFGVTVLGECGEVARRHAEIQTRFIDVARALLNDDKYNPTVQRNT